MSDAPAPGGTGHLDVLTEEECLDLLRGRSVGRIVFVDDGQPMAVPVNYVVQDTTVAFRSDPGTKLDAANLGRVALEIDEVDATAHEGWSVLVTGVGRDITGAIDEWSERVQAQHLTPWAAGERRHWVAISAPTFSGRRIRHRTG
ncbi:MAG: pyridoxamine 5'-phosphate oxidase family protein [Acidimicrobiales bacterium]